MFPGISAFGHLTSGIGGTFYSDGLRLCVEESEKTLGFMTRHEEGNGKDGSGFCFVLPFFQFNLALKLTFNPRVWEPACLQSEF